MERQYSRRNALRVGSSIGAVAVAAFAGCLADDADDGDDADDEPGAENRIEVGDSYFEPDSLTVEPGTTVEWHWVGSIAHNVNPTDQPDDADWEGYPDFEREGHEYAFTFEVPGEYAYTCDPHAGMDGTIVVEE